MPTPDASSQNSSATRWSNDDFDSLSWHDNYIHGFSIREGEHGEGEFTLDIDFILEWLCDRSTRRCDFRIAPATLTFHRASDLVIHVDYAQPTAALGPASISEIAREPHVYPSGYRSFRWSIELNWPVGKLTFLAEGFTPRPRRNGDRLS
ncbi:MAG: hypothetical protein U0X73_17620 [Thermoanaerobaculia bacterium]